MFVHISAVERSGLSGLNARQLEIGCVRLAALSGNIEADPLAFDPRAFRDWNEDEFR